MAVILKYVIIIKLKRLFMNHRNLGIQKKSGHFNDGLTSLNNTLQRRSAMSNNTITSTANATDTNTSTRSRFRCKR